MKFIKTTLREYLKEDNNSRNEEEIQMYIDIISMNPVKNKKYIDLLKTKHNIDFYDYYNDEQYITNVNLDNIKKKEDFLNFDKYIEYAREVFKKRNIETPFHINKVIDSSVVKNIGQLLGFDIKIKEYSGNGNYASFDFNHIITVPKEVDVNTLIHEIGHFFDYNYSNGYKGLAKTITFASSSYHISKNSEVFAENFMHYFIAPNLLKDKLPRVYKELDKNIPDNFKDILNALIKK